MITLTNELFENDFLNSNEKEYCFVKFYAIWCGPCRMMIPSFNKLENMYTNIDFYQVDVDKSQEFVDMFDIKSVPAFAVIKKIDNKNYDFNVYVGLKSFEDLNNIVKEHINE